MTFYDYHFYVQHLNQIPGLMMTPISCRHNSLHKTATVRKMPRYLANPAIPSDKDAISLATLGNGLDKRGSLDHVIRGEVWRALFHYEIERRHWHTTCMSLFERRIVFQTRSRTTQYLFELTSRVLVDPTSIITLTNALDSNNTTGTAP